MSYFRKLTLLEVHQCQMFVIYLMFVVGGTWTSHTINTCTITTSTYYTLITLDDTDIFDDTYSNYRIEIANI